MKKKRGFTLIEIIVCIILLGVVGTISIVVINKDEDKSLTKITNKILEAANVYIETEKDKDGNTYAYGINNGGKGVTIPLKELVNSGYVSEKDSNEVKDLTKLENDDKYFVLLANNTDLCETGSVLEIASWNVDSDKGTLYLCDNVTEPITGAINNKKLSEHILDMYGNDKIYEINSFDDINKFYKVDGSTIKINEIPEYNLLFTDEFNKANNDLGIVRVDPSNGKQIPALGYKDVTDVCAIELKSPLCGYDYFASHSYSSSIHGLINVQDNSEYYFTGLVENNYVTIYDKIFKIMSFDNESITLVGNFLLDIDKNGEGTIYSGNIYDNYSKVDSKFNKVLNTFAKELAENINVDSNKINNFYFESIQNNESNGEILHARMINNDDFRNAGSYLFFDDNLADFGQGLINSYLNYSDSDLSKNDFDGNNYLVYSIEKNKFLNYFNSTYNDLSLRNDRNYKVRPVIKLNMEHISYTGHGTCGAPYIISYKD